MLQLCVRIQQLSKRLILPQSIVQLKLKLLRIVLLDTGKENQIILKECGLDQIAKIQIMSLRIMINISIQTIKYQHTILCQQGMKTLFSSQKLVLEHQTFKFLIF